MQRLARRNNTKRKNLTARHKILTRFLEQEHLNSFDLDLLCFCYDKEGDLLLSVFPNTIESVIDPKNHAAFFHLGDDTTGTGDTFDEELLIKLPAVNAVIDSIYLVTISNNHGFNEIKGGSWSVISTENETELCSSLLHHSDSANICVMAKVIRENDSWRLENIDAFHRIDRSKNVSFVDNLKDLILTKYAKAGPKLFQKLVPGDT